MNQDLAGNMGGIKVQLWFFHDVSLLYSRVFDLFNVTPVGGSTGEIYIEEIKLKY